MESYLLGISIVGSFSAENQPSNSWEISSSCHCFIAIVFTMPEVSKPLFVADPSKGIKVDAAVIATPFRDEIKAKVAEMKEQGMGTYFNVP